MQPWAEPSIVAVSLAGPALSLLGNILFKRATAPRMVLSHVMGLRVLACLTAAAAALARLLLGAAAAPVLVVVAAWESCWSLRSQRLMGPLRP